MNSVLSVQGVAVLLVLHVHGSRHARTRSQRNSVLETSEILPWPLGSRPLHRQTPENMAQGNSPSPPPQPNVESLLSVDGYLKDHEQEIRRRWVLAVFYVCCCFGTCTGVWKCTRTTSKVISGGILLLRWPRSAECKYKSFMSKALSVAGWDFFGGF